MRYRLRALLIVALVAFAACGGWCVLFRRPNEISIHKRDDGSTVIRFNGQTIRLPPPK